MLQLAKKSLSYAIRVPLSCALLACVSCGGDADSAIDRYLNTYCADGIVSVEEMEKLTAIIKAKPALYTKEGLLVDGEVNKDRLTERIRQIGGEEVQFGEASEKQAIITGKPNYNVFIENSASMDGYVTGLSEFKNTVYHFLSELKSPLKEVAGTLSLYYINSKPIPFPDQIEDFIEKLDPNTFRSRGGNRGETDFSNILDTIFALSKPNEVNILVSDCVFSPGSNKDAANYLANQSIGIQNAFEAHLSRQRDLKTLVVKLKSSFDGVYYDYQNQKLPLSKEERPYYLWMIGPSAALNNLLKNISLTELVGFQYIHEFNSREEKPEYRILLTKRIGRFNPDREDMLGSIVGAEKENRGPNQGLFQFAIGVELDNFGLDPSYLSNPDNYRLSPEHYQIQVEPISFQDKQKNKLLNDYSHYLLLKTDNLRNETLKIELLRAFPNWVETSNSMDDKNQIGEELGKTYGLKHLIDGVSNAYGAALGANKDVYFHISVPIKK